MKKKVMHCKLTRQKKWESAVENNLLHHRKSRPNCDECHTGSYTGQLSNWSSPSWYRIPVCSNKAMEYRQLIWAVLPLHHLHWLSFLFCVPIPLNTIVLKNTHQKLNYSTEYKLLAELFKIIRIFSFTKNTERRFDSTDVLCVFTQFRWSMKKTRCNKHK